MRPKREPTTEFGKRLRELREKRGLTQPQLAEMCGISLAHISMLETGYRQNVPRRDTILKLADALGVSKAEMLELAGYEVGPEVKSEKPNAVETAIKTDKLLREEQKRLMLEQYRMFTGRPKPKFK